MFLYRHNQAGANVDRAIVVPVEFHEHSFNLRLRFQGWSLENSKARGHAALGTRPAYERILLIPAFGRVVVVARLIAAAAIHVMQAAIIGKFNFAWFIHNQLRSIPNPSWH